MILRPDKGNGVVIMNRKDYICGMNNIINDRSKFKLLTEDPTPLREGQLQRFLRKLKNEGFFNDDVYKSVYPTGSRPARMYGLPKLHKIFETVSSRQTVSLCLPSKFSKRFVMVPSLMYIYHFPSFVFISIFTEW